MIHILIVCVNFNSYIELHAFLQSVEKSASTLCGAMQTDVIIADNSTEKENVACECYKSIHVKQMHFENLGYFGGAQAVINNIKDIEQYKYVMISNVDLEFQDDTLKKLQTFDVEEDIAWVAPSIFSIKYQKDLNPNVFVRYKSWKLKMLRLTYSRFTYKLYERFYYSKRKKTTLIPQSADIDIYAGHGSCIILTSNFFKIHKQLNYPVFLYGEELYLAELILHKGMKVKYVPAIKINTIGSVSTSKMPSKSFLKYNKEAIDYILKTFY